MALALSCQAGQAVQRTVLAFGDNAMGQLGDGSNPSIPLPSLISNAVKISAGSSFNLILRSNGTIYAWGKNDFGQLGNGTTLNSSVPIQVANLSDVLAISAGSTHSLALKNDGTVWAWGDNRFGQLGIGSEFSSLVPVQISTLSNIAAISAGYSHSLASNKDGTVFAWGGNSNGELGNGTITGSDVPIQVSVLTGVSAVSAHPFFSLALTNDGTVYSWGRNSNGALGNGTETDSSIPAPLTSISGITAISDGGYHCLALKNDGTVFAWGSNFSGQLGIGSKIASNVPVQVSGLSGAIGVATGFSHSLAVKNDGTVVSWGSNSVGQLGNGVIAGISFFLDQTTPIPVNDLTGITAVSVGNNHSVAVKNNGTAFAWGSNQFGQLGNGTTGTESIIPVQTASISGITAVAAGGDRSLALKSDGTVWIWGDQPGSAPFSRVPMQVANLSSVVAITHRLAVKDDGTVWSIADGTPRHFENGTTARTWAGVRVRDLSNITAIASGFTHDLALRNDGTVWAWGDNLLGQLGNGTTDSSDVPVQVVKLINATAITAGQYCSFALRSDGTAVSWGANINGSLGTGKTKDSLVPVQVKGLSGAVKIASGDRFTLALLASGKVKAWGENERGQLGNGKLTPSLAPFTIFGLSNVATIAAGAEHSLAIKTNGAVLAWGSNQHGECARFVFSPNASAENVTTPALVQNINGATAVAAGHYHSLVVVNSLEFAETFLSPAMVMEQQPAGSQVGFFSTSDPSGLFKAFTYTFATGDGDADNASFSLSNNALLTAAVFDFDVKPTYSIRIRSTDNLGGFVEKAFTITVLAQPNSGADGTQNVSTSAGVDGIVVNPVNDLVITIARSDGGVITLQITITPGANELEASTAFDDVQGRKSIVVGFSPTHKFSQKGIFVAEVSVVEKVSRLPVATGRKMINIDRLETGLPSLTLRGQPRLLDRPPSTRIPTKDMKGTFYFNGTRSDTVKYVGTFVLPKGFDTRESNEFSFGVGNVIVDAIVDGKGKVTPETGSLHASNNSFFQKMSIKYSRIPKDGIAAGGETATFTATVLSSLLSNKGFDTEGITNTPAKDLTPGQTADRFIQVSYNLSGVAYEDRAAVVFLLDKNSDFGVISGRSTK